MAELTNLWMDQVTGTPDFCYPKVWLEPQNMQKAAEAIIKDDLAGEISIAKHAEMMVELYNRIMADKGTTR